MKIASKLESLSGAAVWVAILAATSAGWAKVDSRSALPEQIPQGTACRAEIIGEIIAECKAIDDAEERYLTLASALGWLHGVPAQDVQPLLALLVTTADEVEDEGVLPQARDALMVVAPDVRIDFAERARTQRARDEWVRGFDWSLSPSLALRAKRLVEQIQTPDHRGRAMASLAMYGRLDYSSTVELLERSAELHSPESRWGSLSGFFSGSLARFAAERPTEVREFVLEQLETDDACYCLEGIGWRLLRDGHGAEARRFLDAAADLITRTSNSEERVPYLIRAGLGESNPKRAIAMFDKHVMSALLANQIGANFALSSLASVDIESLIDRSSTVAKEANYEAGIAEHLSLRDPAVVAGRAIGRAAADGPRDRVLSWLAENPAGPIRQAAVARVAGSLSYSSDSRLPEVASDQAKTLWSVAQNIQDAEARWAACTNILNLLDAHGAPFPKEIVSEYRVLALENPHLLGRDDGLTSRGRIRFLPIETQREIIYGGIARSGDRDWYYHLPSAIHHSTLPVAEKRSIYAMLILFRSHDRVAITYVAEALATIDLSWSLRLMWWVLPDHHQQEPSPHDVLAPPVSVPGALSWVLSEYRLGGGPFGGGMIGRTGNDVIPTLWSFAKRVSPEDRDAVLEGIARILLRQVRRGLAVGVARLIGDRAKRVVLLAQAAGTWKSPEWRAP